ncbi:MAG: phosphoribosylformylglycinamidine synthase, partial [Deltaproteobacteria bacterium]
PDQFLSLYRALSKAIGDEVVASAHGIYRGGLGVHIALVAMGGNLGMDVDLGPMPVEESLRDDILLFSESAGRFLVTVDPAKRDVFKQQFKGQPCACVGKVLAGKEVSIKGTDGEVIFTKTVAELKEAWKKPFGDLI